MKMAILGAGGIAEKMAATIKEMPEVEAYAVASRSLEKAEKFAEQHGFEKAYGSYEEMVKDEAVDLVYVATPHSHHLEHGKLCARHGKNMLVEKAFTQNAGQAKELLELAKEKRVLAAEAIWTRYMPSKQMILDVMESGIIGEIHSLHATLSYPVAHVERIRQPELAGGALLDLGVYPLNFAFMAFGDDVERIDASASLAETGVDMAVNMTLTYRVQNINNCEKICVYDHSHELLKEISVPAQISGYEYEVLACMEAIQKGELECPQMPHKEIIRMMEVMDEVRAKIGVAYPNEK